MKNTGKFIVIEGIDGCGKGTQTKLLSDFLSKKGYDIVFKKYPEYGKPIGDLINKWLHSKEYDFNVEAQTLLYFADFIKDKEYLENNLKNGKIILSDRYFTSTIVYQRIKGMPMSKLDLLSQMFGLVKPDLVIYIKISPETSFERKSSQKDLDRHEGDKKFLKKLFDNFEETAKKYNWETVDGEKPIEKVTKDIINIVNKII
ncbi:MAG: putative thymidylate kinase [Parcubacteria bacterium 33_209]|nr:MAG: putative thymidylate kinase [Parcubacteria bacterium 33_209]